jgi:hypothetical protein
VITTPKGETFEKHLKCDQFFTRAAALALVLTIEFGFGHGTTSRWDDFAVRLVMQSQPVKWKSFIIVQHCFAAYGFLICEREAICNPVGYGRSNAWHSFGFCLDPLVQARGFFAGCPVPGPFGWRERAVQSAQIAVATGCAAIKSSVVIWLLKY